MGREATIRGVLGCALACQSCVAGQSIRGLTYSSESLAGRCPSVPRLAESWARMIRSMSEADNVQRRGTHGLYAKISRTREYLCAERRTLSAVVCGCVRLAHL